MAETDGATVVEEDGFSDAFTIVLTAQPVTDVVFTVTSDDVEEVTVVRGTSFYHEQLEYRANNSSRSI